MLVTGYSNVLESTSAIFGRGPYSLAGYRMYPFSLFPQPTYGVHLTLTVALQVSYRYLANTVECGSVNLLLCLLPASNAYIKKLTDEVCTFG